MKQLPEIVLKKGKEKPVLAFHPWIFSGAIELVDDAIVPGELVKVLASDNTFLGIGYFNPQSQISVRLLTFKNEPLDISFFKHKIVQAKKFRESFLPAETNAYRLIHSEGDGLPGLIVDKYADFLLVQFQTLGMDKLKPFILEALNSLVRPKGIYERADAKVGELEGIVRTSQVLAGDKPPELIQIKEYGKSFLVDIMKGQKTGFFLDQRENRKLVGEHSKGKRVLNCFSYTGGFSIYAALAGAQSVTSVEISEHASELAKKNFELNKLTGDHYKFVSKDVFDFLREANKEEYDLIVLDPPAFCKGKGDVQKASRGYKDINLQAMKHLSSGGLLFTFSCSSHIDPDLFQKIVFAAAKDAKKDVKILSKICHPWDHPMNIYHPEGEYLKGLVCAVFDAV